MKINPIFKLNFKKYLVINYNDSNSTYTVKQGRTTNKLAKIMDIASENGRGVYVGDKLIINKPNRKLKKDLLKESISYEEVNDRKSIFEWWKQLKEKRKAQRNGTQLL